MDIIFIFLFLSMALMGIICLCVNNKKIKIFGLLLLILEFSYICSIRPLTSSDTQTYFWYYEKSKYIVNFKFGIGRDYYPWIENWFINFSWLCSNKLNLSYRQFLFVVSFLFNAISIFSIINIFKMKYGKILNSYLIITIFLLFFVNYGFLYSYVVIRGGLSFAFCLLTYSYFLNKKYFKMFVSIFIAILLHNYSIVFIPILLITKIKFKRKHNKLFMFIFVILLIMNLLRTDVLFTNYLQKFNFLFSENLFQITHYLVDAEQTTSLRKGIVLYLIQNIYLIVLLYNNEENLSNEFLILVMGSIISVLINDNGTIRITNYFFLFQIFLYGKYLYDNIKTNGKSKTFVLNVIILTIIIPVVTFIYMLRYCSVI